MKISRKSETKTLKICPTCVAVEYPLLSDEIQGSLIKLNGRYPETGFTLNEVCVELVYILGGSGYLGNKNGERLEFIAGDQLVIEPGEQYFWEAKATMFVPCAPAWYPEQHKKVEK